MILQARWRWLDGSRHHDGCGGVDGVVSTSRASPSQARGEGEEKVQQQPYSRGGAARAWRGGAGYGGEGAAARAPREGAARAAIGWCAPLPCPSFYMGRLGLGQGLAGPPLPWPPSWGAPLWASLAGLAHMGPCVVRLAQVASSTPLVHVGPISYVGPTSRLL